MSFSGLEQLASVSDFADALRENRQEMRTFHKDIIQIKLNIATPHRNLLTGGNIDGLALFG